jgi:dephospho-CoA kinase
MLVIGLTGGIASGKSTVSRMLKRLGAHIIDADAVVRELMTPGQPTHADIVRAFGAGVLDPDGTIDRRRLGRMVFADPSLLAQLNAITHPRVIQAIQARLGDLERQGQRVAVVDAPLLIEAGMTGMVDEVWVVAVDPATQVRRLMSRDHYSRREAVQRLRAQLPLEEKVKHATRVIDNTGSLARTRRQVRRIWQELGLEGGDANPEGSGI